MMAAAPYKAPATPTLERLAAVHDERVTVVDFVEWLNQQGIHLARYVQYEGWRDPILSTISEPADSLFLRYAGLDPAVIEAERRALLDSIREDKRP